MSIYHIQSLFSKDMASLVLDELSNHNNQIFIEDKIIDPLMTKVLFKLRGVFISFGVLISLLILLNTLIIIQFIYNRKNR
tara:strand:- start:276 stop:515 length:240 start_codon:yes stop_codon:yes gene_type:complete